jgi:hypothetical protein
MNENQGSIGFFWSRWMESAVDMWLSAVRAWQPPCEMTEAFMRMLGPAGGGHEIFEWLWNSGESTGQSLEKFKQEAVNSWMSIYETAFQPLLKMPQVGLTRVYQEKINTGLPTSSNPTRRPFPSFKWSFRSRWRSPLSK